MMDKWLVLICDNETGEWSIALQRPYKEETAVDDAVEVYAEADKLKERLTGVIVLVTQDYVTV